MRIDFVPNTDNTVLITYTDSDEARSSPSYWGACKGCAQIQELTKQQADEWPELCEACVEDARDRERAGDCELDNAWDYAEAMEVATEGFYRA